MGATDSLLPEVVIAGAWKCGSTALWEALSTHPQINPCRRKEPAYFDRNYHAGPAYFDPLFDQTRPGLRLEGTIGYLVSPEAPERMARDARLIFILRDPVHRAVSHFNWRRAIGKERTTWQQVIDEGHQAPVIDASRYGTHVSRFLDRFPTDRLLVLQTEAFRAEPQHALDRVSAFLGLERPATLTPEVVNPSKIARSDAAARALAVARDRLRRTGAMDRAAHPWRARADRAVQLGINLNSVVGRYPDPPPPVAESLHELLRPEVDRLSADVDLDRSLWPTGGDRG